MSWLCYQLGSREHYSIPRALHANNSLALLQTDAWITPKWQWFPKALRQAALATRFHNDLEKTPVRAFNSSRVLFDLLARVSRRKPWDTIELRDQWFQRKCIPRLKRTLRSVKNPIVFSYSYTARTLFEVAKREGAVCILGQVDPGPGEIEHLKTVLPPEISQRIEDRPESYWDSWRKEIELADHILVNSSWSKELLIKYSEVPEEKIKVVPLAYTRDRVESPKQYPTQFTQHRPLKLLFLGQVIHRKGVHLLLEAMEGLADQPVTLDLAGPIDQSFPVSPTHRLTASQPHRLTVHGPVDRQRTRQLYREADVFILPTLSDGFALTQLEAAAYRLPLITSRFCGQVVQSADDGLILDEVNADNIKAAIMHCITNPKNLAKWSAHELNWNEYSIERLGDRLAAVAATTPKLTER
ncbi:MAG: glycosyltransferase family 4 protein [Verrucomicrobiota bacterium]